MAVMAWPTFNYISNARQSFNLQLENTWKKKQETQNDRLRDYTDDKAYE